VSEAELAARSPPPQSAPAAPVVVARDLSIDFGSMVALSDVSLSFTRGDFVSLIGPSGCGKTTLLRAVADLVPPSRGSLMVNGMTPGDARRARSYGYVFQAPALYPWRSVERNVMLPLEIMGLPKAEQRRRAAHYLGLVGLGDFARKFP